MKKLTIVLAAIAICFGITINTFAQKTKTSSNTVVTTTIQDNVKDESGVITHWYSIRSDLFGSYFNGVDSVESIIQGIGDAELDLLPSPTRKVSFDFSSEIAGTNVNGIAAPNSGTYSARYLSQCSVKPGKKLQDLRISDGAIYCPLNIKIQVGSEEYSLRFRTAEFPGSTYVAWTCTSETSVGKCNSWRMESASMDGTSNIGVARLLKLKTVKGKITTQSGSLYNFTFKVDLKVP